MEQAIAAVTNLRDQWSGLIEARPNELDLNTIGLNASAEMLKTLFQGWLDTLTLLSGKATRLDPTEGALANTQLTKWVNELVSNVVSARSNGGQWLIQQPQFLDRLISISGVISLIAGRRTEIARHLAKQLASESIGSASTLLEAEPKAASFLEKSSDITMALDEIAAQQTKIQKELTEWRDIVAGFEDIQQEVEDTKNTILGRNGEIEQLYKDIVGYRSQAELKSGELERRITELNSEVEKAKIEANTAVASLQAALIDARKQGLAGAFTDRGAKVQKERRTWGIVFSGAVVVLLVLALAFVGDLTKFTYEALTVNLLRRLAVAGPMIWVGWYAAKQIGRLGRIREDYEYKAATALAFQSYKSEVATVGDDALTTELLQRAIATFGENPVRLYGNEHHDPVSPVSELLKQVDKDDTFKLLKKISELMK